MKAIIDITDEYYESVLDLRDRYGEEHLFTSMKAILNGTIVDKEKNMVAIKNFKMPKNCDECNFYHINEDGCDYCDIDFKEVVPFGDNRRDDCLLIEIEGRCDL